METLKQAILIRMDAFDACGCVASDHGFEYMPDVRLDDGELNDVFAKALRGEKLSLRERDGYKTELMLWLAAQYHRRGWAMELHVGALRDANQHGVKTVGEAKGMIRSAMRRLRCRFRIFSMRWRSAENCPRQFCLT